MRLNEYKTALPFLLAAKVTPLVWGRHGIGKSTAPEQFAKENGHMLFNLRLGNMEVGDLLGLPSTAGDVTQFNMPDWLKEVYDFARANPTKFAIIHLDEINRVRKDMLSPVFQIALDYKLHTYVFPDNVRVLASANPPTDDYQGVYDITDCAFLDRFCHIKLEPSTDEWLEFVKAEKLSDDMTLFYGQHPNLIEHIGKDFDVQSLIKPSRRSSIAAMRLYALGSPEELVYGCIGSSAGQMLYAWLQKNKAKAIRGEEVRTAWKKTKPKVQKLVDNGEIAAIKVICTEITDYYKTVKDAAAISAKEMKDLQDFFDTIPEDVAYGNLRLLLRGSEVLALTDFGMNEAYSKKWLAKVTANPELKETVKEAEPTAEEKTA